MLIRNSKAFARGLLLLFTFAIVFVMFFMPIFDGHEDGTKSNGLEYADHLFNTLSKGSANFFDPTLSNKDSVNLAIQPTKDKTIKVTVPFKKPDNIDVAEKILIANGLTATKEGQSLKIEGDLFAMLSAIIDDSQVMYQDKGEELSQKYNGLPYRQVMTAWWEVCSYMIKPLQRLDQIDEASIVSVVIMKAIEPAYNFYGITPIKVSDNIPLVAGFLIFYVIYTMWYGFAIFELFEGIGLNMKKSKKQEV